MLRVPVQMIPDLDARTVSILTAWPGAGPQDIEREILIEQENYLRSIPNLDRMTSKAETGSATIELEFPYGVDINDVLIRVNNALTQVPGYPEDVDQPRMVTSSFSDTAFMFFRIQPLPGNPKNVNLVSMHDFVNDNVRTRIERVAGVSQVDLWGGAKRQIRIYVDPAKLAQRQISLSELRSTIRARNRDISGGDIDSGKRRYLLRTVGRFEDVADIENMVIAQREGAMVRLRDVGYVELSHFEIRVRSYANGKPNLTLGVRRQVGTNVIDVMDGVMESMAEINESVLKPNGMQVELTSEDVQYVKDAISVVRQNVLLGALLATLVLFLFLRSPSATLVGACGIPVCTIAAFLGLLVMGRTINVISLAGVAFAIGMTLDNSIVVLESIFRHRSMGKSKYHAALEGVQEVWTAVLASTLTTVFVFLPVIFVTEEAGQLYSDIAIAISASVLMSMIVAVTIIPSACSRFLHPPRLSSNQRSIQFSVYRAAAACGVSIMAIVEWLMLGVSRRLLLVVGTFVATALIILLLTPKTEYLPEGEESKTFSFMFAPTGYNLEEMSSVLDKMHDYFLPALNDSPDRFHNGQTDVPALRFVVSYVRSNMILMIVETKDNGDIDDLIALLTKKFAEVPGVISFSSRGSIFASNLGGTRSINLDISGSKLDDLLATSLTVYQFSKEIFDNPQVRPQPSSLTMGQPLMEIRPNWERAAELGISADELGYAVWALSDGAFVDEYFLDDDKIDIYLFNTQGTVNNPEELQYLQLYSREGGVITLGSVAEIRRIASTEVLRRVDGQRTVTLSIVPPREIPLAAALSIVESEIIQGLFEAGKFPPGINVRISGASDRLESTLDALGMNFLVAILISYLLMVAIFSHWGYPLIIMTTVPLGISGGIVGLWMFNFLCEYLFQPVHQPFDVITMLGFLVLIGTVVNNPILLVEQTLKNIRDKNMEPRRAVVEGTRTRLRPIVMSSVTTILGLSPLVFLPGAGTELYRGLGVIVLSGIFFSTLVTLTFLPALLSLVLQMNISFRRRNNLTDLA